MHTQNNELQLTSIRKTDNDTVHYLHFNVFLSSACDNVATCTGRQRNMVVHSDKNCRVLMKIRHMTRWKSHEHIFMVRSKIYTPELCVIIFEFWEPLLTESWTKIVIETMTQSHRVQIFDRTWWLKNPAHAWRLYKKPRKSILVNKHSQKSCFFFALRTNTDIWACSISKLKQNILSI